MEVITKMRLFDIIFLTNQYYLMNSPLRASNSCHLSFFEHLLCAGGVLTTLGNIVFLIMTNFYAAGVIIPILQVKRPQLLETE